VSDIEILKLIADLPANLSGLNVNAQVNVSGQPVGISGETIRALISGDYIVVTSGAYLASGLYVQLPNGQAVKISGQTVVAEVSGQPVKISGEILTVLVSGPQIVKVSGETLRALISGDYVQVASGLYLASGIYVQTAGGGGGQVSGAVIISGDIRSVLSGLIQVASGAYLASGLYVQTAGGGGGQVSGAVIISGDVRSVLSGLIRSLISGDTVRALVSGDVVDVLAPTVLKTGLTRSITAASGGEVLHSGATRSIIVKAQGIMYMGGSGSRPYSGYGLEVLSGEAVVVDANNFDAVYLFAPTSGQKVTFLGIY